MEGKEWTIDELILHSKAAIDKQIKDLVSPESLDYYQTHSNNKGWVGNAIQQDYYQLPINSLHEADFANIDVELKVTPIKHTRNGWSAKERLVFNVMNFNDEWKRTFETASFMEKARLTELVQYEYQSQLPSPEFSIKAATFLDLYDLPKEDLLIIKNDWQIIVDKIKEGKAEELSESLTQYLGAATKGAKTKQNMVDQPFSEAKAHQRAFCLKTSYMTQLTRSIMAGKFYSAQDERVLRLNKQVAEDAAPIKVERIVQDVNELQENSLEDIIISRFLPYIGKTKQELAQQFNISIPDKNDKASTAAIAKAILNLEGDIQNTDEFLKSGMIMKTVVINARHTQAKESLKLKTVDFDEIDQTDWEDSDLRDYLDTHRFMLVVFSEEPEGIVFRGVKFWQVPFADLEGDIHDSWLHTQKIVREGVTLTYKAANNRNGYRVSNNFIKASARKILHIRPNAATSSYQNNSNACKMPHPNQWINRPDHLKDQLTDDYLTRQAYWLNQQYMFEQVKDLLI